ncbi:ABATE domain-containing protein, partial [Streptomyces sp. NPDC002920]
MGLDLDTAMNPYKYAYELRFDSGRSSLDLLATSHPHEHLDAVGPLCAWIRGAGLVPPDTPLPHADDSWPAAFRELRTSVGRLVSDWLTRTHPGAYDVALARVNEAACAAPPVPRAVHADDGSLV